MKDKEKQIKEENYDHRVTLVFPEELNKKTRKEVAKRLKTDNFEETKAAFFLDKETVKEMHKDLDINDSNIWNYCLNPDIACPVVEKLTGGKVFFVNMESFKRLPFSLETLKDTAIFYKAGWVCLRKDIKK